jgi:hypothetical protein
MLEIESREARIQKRGRRERVFREGVLIGADDLKLFLEFFLS